MTTTTDRPRRCEDCNGLVILIRYPGEQVARWRQLHSHGCPRLRGVIA